MSTTDPLIPAQRAATRPHATSANRSAGSTERPRHARPSDPRPTLALQRRLIAGMVG